jgi:predicted DNA-binding ribbon-helix-helix protein
MEVTFTLDLPKEVFDFLKEVAEEAEVPITSVVKEILEQRINKEAALCN